MRFADLNKHYFEISAFSSTELGDEAEVLAQCERELARADWLISAELAGLEDDDEAAAFVERLRARTARAMTREWDRQVLDLGILKVYVMREHAVARTKEWSERSWNRSKLPLLAALGQVQDGVGFLIPGSALGDSESALQNRTLRQVAQGTAIGLADGWQNVASVGSKVWLPETSTWYDV